MPDSYDEILTAQHARINVEQASANAELEAARLSDDAYLVNAAADQFCSWMRSAWRSRRVPTSTWRVYRCLRATDMASARRSRDRTRHCERRRAYVARRPRANLCGAKAKAALHAPERVLS